MLESDQTTAGSADVRRRNIWPLLLIFGFLGLLAGLLVGGIYFTKYSKVYQSQATINATEELETSMCSGTPSAQVRLAVAEKMEEIEAQKSLYEELLLDLRKSEAALKDGREACLEYVRILENGGKLEVGSFDDVSPEEIIQRFITSKKKQIGELRTALNTDLTAYSEIYEEAVLSEQNVTKTVVHKGFLFEITRPAYRGRQVRPVLAVILPVFALIGAVVGLWFAYLGVLVVGATS